MLALSPNFIPAFRILNPAGVEILAAPNADAQASLTASASFPDTGDYRIEILGVNGTLGQFVLSLQAGAPLPDPVELTADQPVSATVSSQTPLAIYHFSTPPTDPLILTVLTVLTDTPDTGLLLSLYDETAAKTIITSDASLSGIALRLPATETSYRLEIRAGSTTDTPYTLCLGVCPASLLTSAAQPTTAVPTPESVAVACNVTPNGNPSVNIRSGPGTQFTAIGTLFAGQPLPILAQLAGGAWLQVSLSNGAAGWVAASVTRLEGDCAALPLVAAPANAPLAPTLPPPPVPTNPPPSTTSGSGAPPPTNAPAPTAEPPPVQPHMSVVITSVTPISGSYKVDFTITVSAAPLPQGYSLDICLDRTCDTFGQPAMPIGDDTITVFLSDSLLDGRRILHEISVTIDSANEIAESNEGNNVAIYNFQ